jgi:hypothetical protein
MSFPARADRLCQNQSTLKNSFTIWFNFFKGQVTFFLTLVTVIVNCRQYTFNNLFHMSG